MKLPASSGGAGHAIVGTLEQVALALAWSLPLGVMAAVFLNECRQMGIPVLVPDVNESVSDFSVGRDKEGKPSISFGMAAIRNVGSGVEASIVEIADLILDALDVQRPVERRGEPERHLDLVTVDEHVVDLQVAVREHRCPRPERGLGNPARPASSLTI